MKLLSAVLAMMLSMLVLMVPVAIALAVGTLVFRGIMNLACGA